MQQQVEGFFCEDDVDTRCEPYSNIGCVTTIPGPREGVVVRPIGFIWPEVPDVQRD